MSLVTIISLEGLSKPDFGSGTVCEVVRSIDPYLPLFFSICGCNKSQPIASHERLQLRL